MYTMWKRKKKLLQRKQFQKNNELASIKGLFFNIKFIQRTQCKCIILLIVIYTKGMRENE